MDSRMTVQQFTTPTLSQHSPTLGAKRIVTDMEPAKKAKEDEINHASDALPSPAAEPIGTMEPLEMNKLVEEIASPPLTAVVHTTMMTRDQIRYATAVVRNLKKHRDAAYFLHPVDHTDMNVRDYPTVITHPMDLNTVDRKLSNNEYPTVNDFVNDVRLIFTNCYKYNGAEATISILCQNVESAFEKGLRQMPPSKDVSPSLVNSPGSNDGRRRKPSPTAASITNDNIRRFSEDGRPRREIHPPRSKDYPETWTKKRNPNTNTAELKFCGQAIKELKKAKYMAINHPFLQPVDYVALNIPDYPTIVKEPMDLSTIEKKWNTGNYTSADLFEKDIRLMFKNCYLYNAVTLPVHQMGKSLEKVFDEKWQQKPLPESATPTPPPPSSRRSSSSQQHPSSPTNSRRRRSPPLKKSVHAQQYAYEDESSDQDDNDDKITELEQRIATIAQQIQSMKTNGKKQSQSKQRRRSSSQTDKSTTAAKRKRRRTSLPDLTIQQKSDLSHAINNLAGEKLNKVARIIQSSMPNLDGDDEIELDINSLDRKTLHELHEFVTGKSLSSTTSRQKSTSLKRPRQGLSEAASNRKIRELEEKLRQFEEANNRDASSDSDSSSSSDSGSDSSDSD